jgi:hypothetical protein
MTLQARSFGSAATDLDVAFGARPADVLATEVLARCVGEAADTVQGWTLARRLQALIAVRLADDAGACASAAVSCAACGSGFEFELPLARCVQSVDERPMQLVSPAGHCLSVRLPHAGDLTAWRAAGLRDGNALAASLVLAVDGQAPGPGFSAAADVVEAIAERLAERDPFTALQVQAACPECGHGNEADVDLETLLLRDFARLQRRLLDEVATLARAFHWSEAQILGLPAWRRAHYLAPLAPLEAP